MLASRELASQLPAQALTWVNENLEFTHGEGLVMNFVSSSTGGGLPQYLLENTPAESQYGLNITQPAIYFGEVAPGYKIVSTGIKEFDYPKGHEKLYVSCQGKGGIPLDSNWKRILFAWTQKDINMLITPYLTPQSKSQNGPGVIRGKLIVTPIENSFLYVVPLYLKAEGTNFLQLKRVIVATGDKVVMEPTLDAALISLFETAPPQSGSSPGQQPGVQTPLSRATRDQATAQLAEAQKALNALKQLLANPPQ